MPRHPAPSCFQLGTRPSLVELSLISRRRNHRLRCSTHLELSSTRTRFARNSRVQGPPRQRRSHTCTRTPRTYRIFPDDAKGDSCLPKAFVLTQDHHKEKNKKTLF